MKLRTGKVVIMSENNENIVGEVSEQQLGTVADNVVLPNVPLMPNVALQAQENVGDDIAPQSQVDSGDNGNNAPVAQSDMMSFLSQIMTEIKNTSTKMDQQKTELVQHFDIKLDVKIDQQKTELVQHMDIKMNEMRKCLVETNEIVSQMREDLNQAKGEIDQVKTELKDHKVSFTNKIVNITKQNGEKFDCLDAQMTAVTLEITTNKEVVGYIASQVDNIEKKYEEKLAAVDSGLVNNSRDIRNLQLGQTSPVTHVLQSGIGKPELKFYGDYKIHPKVFIQQLGQFIESFPTHANVKALIQSTMKGDAELWYSMVEEKYQTFDEFRSIFLSNYWGEYNQQKVRHDLFNGKFRERFGSSREQYLIRKYYAIRHLEPVFSETDIVKYLARHFDEDIRKVIVVQRITTMDKLIEYMRSLDDVYFNSAPNNRQNFGREERSCQQQHRVEGVFAHQRANTQDNNFRQYQGRRYNSNYNQNQDFNRQNRNTNRPRETRPVNNNDNNAGEQRPPTQNF